MNRMRARDLAHPSTSFSLSLGTLAGVFMDMALSTTSVDMNVCVPTGA